MMNSPKKTLTDLPDELILETIHHLSCIRSSEPQSTAFKDKAKEKSRQCENHLRLVALHSLCLTSHRLRRIATPALYASFLGTTTWHGYEPLKLFHRTISNPENGFGLNVRLADYVEYVENRLCDYLGNNLYDDTGFYGAINMLSHYFFMLADISKIASNLQHLVIVSLESEDISFWKYFLPNDIRYFSPHLPEEFPEYRFSKLRTVSFQVHAEDYKFGRDYATFRRICAAMASLPRLADFRASGPATNDFDFPLYGLFKTLRRLEITECVLDFDEVIGLWAACEGLRHIVCEWAFLNCGTEEPSDLYTGLLRHTETLETLALDMREVRFNHPLSGAPQPLGSFKLFSALKSLVICETSLLGDTFALLDFPDQHLEHRIAESLPKSLETLTLLLDSEWAYEQDSRLDETFALWHLAEDSKKGLPNLKEVGIRYRMELNAPNLTRAFHEAGLRFEIVKETT